VWHANAGRAAPSERGIHMQAWRKFCAIYEKINKFFLYIAVFCVIAMTVLIMVEILSRGLFNASTLICDEYTGYFVAGMTFCGGAYAMSKGAFLRVDILYLLFKGRFKKMIDLFNTIIGLVYVSFLIKFCWSVFSYSLKHRVVSIYTSRTPLAIPQSVMVIGCVLLLVQLLIEFVNIVTGYEEAEVKEA